MKIENLSGQVITGTHYVMVASFAPGKPFLADSDWSKLKSATASSYICYGKVEITYTVPDADPIKKAVESVESQIESLRAQFQHNLDLLVEKKQQLLAIGCDKSEITDEQIGDLWPEHK